MSDLTFRQATAADLPLLNRLYSEMDGKPPLSPEKIAQIWADLQQLPHCHIYLASQGETAVGTFTLLVIPTMMHPGFHRSALVDAVTVSPAHRSQGIGRAMMAYALELAREAGCYKLMLSSNLRRQRTHEFYRSLGFEQHGWSFSLTV